MCGLVGRYSEIEELETLYNSGKPEFVAVYGRRRIGKTFLIKEVFKDRMTFYHTGLSPFDAKRDNFLQEQLQSFWYSLQKYGLEGVPCPTSWLEAFNMLEKLLEQQDNGTRQVVFIDELPWMDTARSGFITALENFWNGWASSQKNICLVVCGSATSWIKENLINNRGGLYNRLTYEIKLSPFTLRECEDFFHQAGIRLKRFEIVQSYMAIGGVPYYMNYFRKNFSLSQNIDNLYFAKNAKLALEFDRLFGSLFNNPTDYMKVVRFLATRHSGFTRDEISRATGISSGGGLSSVLSGLAASDFVKSYVPFGRSKREVHYKLIDNFCIFYLKFVDGKSNNDVHFWQKNENSAKLAAWRGIAFEEVCMSHVEQIKMALGVAGVTSNESAWAVRGDDENEGTQIDLLIDRNDNVVNLCEMKFIRGKFTIDKNYDEKIDYRVQKVVATVPRSKNVHTTLITTNGLVPNEYSGAFQSVITIDKLFE